MSKSPKKSSKSTSTKSKSTKSRKVSKKKARSTSSKQASRGLKPLTNPQIRALRFAQRHGGQIDFTTSPYRKTFNKYPTKPVRELIKRGLMIGTDLNARLTAAGRAAA